jgi:hypothetical protein
MSIAERTETRRPGKEGSVPVVQVDDGSRAADGAGRRREQGGGSWAPMGAGARSCCRREQGGQREVSLTGPGGREQARGGAPAGAGRRWDSASSEEASSTGRRQTSGAGELRAKGRSGRPRSNRARQSLPWGGGRRRGRRRPIGHRRRRNLASELRRGGPVPACFRLSRTSTTQEEVHDGLGRRGGGSPMTGAGGDGGILPLYYGIQPLQRPI